jgi:excisionase family DNA binding protein
VPNQSSAAPAAPKPPFTLLRKVVQSDCLTVTIEEAAQLLGISVDKAYDLYHQGKLPQPPEAFLGRRMVVLKMPLLRLLGVEIQDLRGLLVILATDIPSAPAADVVPGGER